MNKPADVEALVQTLETCLADLDRLGAYIPAAHVDAALNALHRQHRSGPYPSEMD